MSRFVTTLLLGLSNTYRRGETLRGYRDNYVKCNMAVFFLFLQICLRAVQLHANHKTGRRSTNYTRWEEEGRGGGEGEGRHAYPSELNKHDGKIKLSSNEALQLKQTFLATNRPLFLTITQMHACLQQHLSECEPCVLRVNLWN